MCTHVSKRGSIYYYRRKTPTHLTHIFGKEVVKSLNTKDKSTAEIAGRKMGSYYDDLFAQALIDAPVSAPEMTADESEPEIFSKTPHSHGAALGLLPHEAHVYAARYLVNLKQGRERAINDGVFSEWKDSIDKLEALTMELLEGKLDGIEKLAAPIWQYEAQLKAIQAFKNRQDLPYMDYGYVPRNVLGASKPKLTPAQRQPALALQEVVKTWSKVRSPRLKTIDKMTRVIEQFDSIVGILSIKDISKSHAVTFKNGLLDAGLKPVNIKHYLNQFNTLLNFAVEEALIESNPAKGVSIKVQQSKKEKPTAFSLVALNSIFASPIYKSSERPAGGKGEAAYWLPLIALFTGARIEELCQLGKADVRQESYVDNQGQSVSVWVFNLTDEGEDQTLKNEGSLRTVPMHPTLIALGFIRYLEGIEGSRVFPELSVGAYGSYSANWSKWFGRYLRREMGVIDPRMVFHSFRHSFKNFARSVGIPKEINDKFTGHSSSDVGDSYGADEFPLKPLVEAMKKYEATGVVLPTSWLQPLP